MVKKRNFWVTVSYIIVLVAGVGIALGMFIHYLFFSLSRIPNGRYVTSVESPNHHYKINIYLVESGATVSDSIRGELVNESTHHAKNIYWGYKEDAASVNWMSDEIVSINGHQLNVDKGQIYDWRRNASK